MFKNLLRSSLLLLLVVNISTLLISCTNSITDSTELKSDAIPRRRKTQTGRSSSGNKFQSQPLGNAHQESDRSTPSHKIQHAMGTTTIIGTPQKVVVLTNEATDHLLTLGVKPIGAVESWWGDPYFEYLQGELQGVSVVGEELQPNLEKIATLQPDLIIGSKLRHQNIYAQLTQIAPTVYSETLGGVWQDNLTLYAKALKKEDQAQKLIERWDRRVADFQAQMGDKLNQEVSVVRFLPGQVRVYHQDNFAGKILAEIGLKRPISQQKDKFADEISLENISQIDGDIIFYMTFEPQAKESQKLTQKWLAHPLWQNLQAVQSDRVYQVNDVYWNTGGGIQAANKMLDDLYRYLLPKNNNN